MKKTAILFICLLAIQFSQAQSDKFVGAMERMIGQFYTALEDENLDDLQNVSNAMERVSNAESDEWLAWYYSAYTKIMLALMIEDVSKVDPMLDKADSELDKASELAPKNSEIYVLKSLSASARMRAGDPMSRGMEYGPKLSMLAEQAKSFDPENPRVYLTIGQNTIYTPEQWGGGVDKGCKILREGETKFASFEPKSSIHPDWGVERLEYVLAEMCTEKSEE
jgi:hypothetical protein